MYILILAFITAFTLTYNVIPSIIRISEKKRLFDEPGERRSHTVQTPSLGGIGIFAGVLFSMVLWTPFTVFGDLQYILCAFIIIFLIGVSDDLDPLTPTNKLIGQLLAAIILVFKANIKLTSLYGILGVQVLPEWAAILLSVFSILVIINAFNLVDGINGLSGSLGTLISIVLGSWFFLTKNLDLAIVSFSLAGACIAFLKYNITPAKIFMGDTGSLFLGLTCSILAIQFIEIHNVLPDNNVYAINAAPAVAIGIMILPLFDTLRVFTVRAMRGRSPMSPDRNHLHHLLLDSGLSHMQATSVLVFTNVIFIGFALYFQHIGNMNLLLLILILALLGTAILHYNVRRQKLKEMVALNKKKAAEIDKISSSSSEND